MGGGGGGGGGFITSPFCLWQDDKNKPATMHAAKNLIIVLTIFIFSSFCFFTI